MSNVHRNCTNNQFAYLLRALPNHGLPTIVIPRGCIKRFKLSFGYSDKIESFEYGDKDHKKIGIMGHAPCFKLIETDLPVFQKPTKINHHSSRYKQIKLLKSKEEADLMAKGKIVVEYDEKVSRYFMKEIKAGFSLTPSIIDKVRFVPKIDPVIMPVLPDIL
jgi:hypothetical protein